MTSQQYLEFQEKDHGILINPEKGKEFQEFYNSIGNSKEFWEHSKEITNKIDLNQLDALMEQD